MIISELIRIFLAWCGEHRATATVKHYRSRLALFLADYGDRELQSLSPLEIEDYLAQAARFPERHKKAGELKSADTRRSNVIAFERLQQFAVEHGALDKKILSKIEKPTGGKRDRIPTAEETKIILAAASPPFALIYRALRQTGARPNELCRARIDDIDKSKGVILLKEHKTARKTGKPRRIGIGKRFQNLIDEAIGDRTEGPIFLGARGSAWQPAHLSRMFSKIRDAAGLDKKLVLYSTRHEHGTMICQAKGIHAAAESLGHASITTTQRYVHPDDKQLRSNQDLFEQEPAEQTTKPQ